LPDGRPVVAEHAEIIVDEHGTAVEISALGQAPRYLEGFAQGMRLFDRLHPDDLDVARMLAERTLREGRSAVAELRWMRRNGRWSRLRTGFGLCGLRLRVTLDYDDVARQRRAEEQMRRVVEGSAQGIVVRTHDEVLYMNDSFARMLGYESHRECIDAQANINSLIHPDDLAVVMSHLEKRIRGEEVVSHYEFRLLHRDGRPIWVEAHAANVNWNGKPASLSWITNVSERKAMEEETRRSKDAAEFANRTKTQFLANMSHELRTPLNAILGFSEVITQELFGPIGEKYLGYALDIHKSGRHLLELVNDVLDLSKLEAGKLELRETEFSIATLVEDCLMLLRGSADEGHIALVAEIPRTLPPLRADPRAAKQLLLNFLSNAVKFTPEGGTVRVAADHDRHSGLFLSVTDTGIGMTPAEIQIALSPFGQIDSMLAGKHVGTGLGLPICRALMELHGGELIVTSTPHIGTTLTARFPAHRVVRARA
jgi:PAS domain S-box-containing protein